MQRLAVHTGWHCFGASLFHLFRLPANNIERIAARDFMRRRDIHCGIIRQSCRLTGGRLIRLRHVTRCVIGKRRTLVEIHRLLRQQRGLDVRGRLFERRQIIERFQAEVVRNCLVVAYSAGRPGTSR